MKSSFRVTFIIFYIWEISYKSQFIKSLPVISNTRQPVLDNSNQTSHSMSLSKVKVKMFVEWNDVLFTHRYQRFDFNSFWWFEQLLNQQLVSKQCNQTYYLISIYEIIIWEGKLSGITWCPELSGLPLQKV